MLHSDFVPKYLKGKGVEIGAFKTPIPGIRPVYVDLFDTYAGERTLADYFGEACALPFFASSLDYVATSHVLEHVANPVRALAEWCRVLRHGGLIYMVVPDRRRTFDHTRPLTPVSHLLEDFRRGTTQVDGTHIDDFVFGVDWQRFSPATKPEAERAEREAQAANYRHAIAHGNQINIHFHTFEAVTLRELVQQANQQGLLGAQLELLEVVEDFPHDCPNGVLVVARVHKNRWQRLLGSLPPSGLRWTAKRF